ncbi:MAG: hypothetical protein Q9M31_07800 [Mariprofundus sp.]|nr:hypothetical protein [Mariprofundus sp.]
METIVTLLPNSANEWLSLCVDIGLITGIFMLWVSWYRNGRRQIKLEQLLLSATSQLDQATHHLDGALQMIDKLQNKHDQQPEQESAPLRYQDHQQQAPRRQNKPLPDRATAPLQQQVAREIPQSSTQATMILRMHREGDSAETIADRLDMPLAQVTLMLKLHANAASSH